MRKFFAENKRKLGLVAGAVGSVVATSAHAALPAEATTAITAVGTAITDSVGAAWVPIGAALAAGITIKLVKRYANKV